jgi:hypothetical protein
MKIIFLDVDGPMIPLRMYYLGSKMFDSNILSFTYDPVAVGMINTLCENNDAQVVFNSAHGASPIEVMRHQGTINGLKYLHEDCKTNYPDLGSRYDAIDEWLINHENQGIEDWIVIDDTVVYKSKQILIDYKYGITMDNFIKASELLGNNIRYPVFISSI